MLRRLSRTTPGVQYKLEIGAVNDPLEAEADRVADHVLRMPDPSVSISSATTQISRKCAACEDEEKKIHAKPDGMHLLSGEAPLTVHEVLNSPGQPLDAGTRAFMEPRFGQDFSQVQVHADERAGTSARDVGALAYATGPHIVFATGQYAPQTGAGRRLIAHELAHTIQQGAGSSTDTAASAPVSRRSGLQRLIQRVGECAGKSYKNCSGGCVPASGKGTGFCRWSGSIATGCVCYARDQPMLREIQQVLFNLIIDALIAAGIVLTAAAIAAIIACLMGPCEAAALIGAVGAAAAAIIMGIIGTKGGSTAGAGGPAAANDASSTPAAAAASAAVTSTDSTATAPA